MTFQYRDAPLHLQRFIECFWVAEDDGLQPGEQKIIPDGFAELIFHHSDPYSINLNGSWEIQAANLLAGQITKHFFLRNTGRSGVIGVKLKPAALSLLFKIDMNRLADSVLPVEALGIDPLNQLVLSVAGQSSVDGKMAAIISAFENAAALIKKEPEPIETAIALIFELKGDISVGAMGKTCFCTERQLERLFKTKVGLSPKYFARIIRFNTIFQLLKEKKSSWTELSFQTGYSDQSHFIRDFKSFTGEDPSRYKFGEENFANFFLMK